MLSMVQSDAVRRKLTASRPQAVTAISGAAAWKGASGTSTARGTVPPRRDLFDGTSFVRSVSAS
jgi:hypothetical protein